MPTNVRQKGQRGEREAATFLGNIYKREVFRALGQARDGGADILDIPGLTIEVKRQETLNVNSWWRQVEIAADNRNEIPVLMWRRNREKWTFCLPAYLLMPKMKGRIQLDETVFAQWLKAYLER